MNPLKTELPSIQPNDKAIADALILYRHENGRSWKSKLKELFFSGQNRDSYLQQFRNKYLPVLNKINGYTSKEQIYSLINRASEVTK